MWSRFIGRKVTLCICEKKNTVKMVLMDEKCFQGLRSVVDNDWLVFEAQSVVREHGWNFCSMMRMFL